jgi:hypothetical protein
MTELNATLAARKADRYPHPSEFATVDRCALAASATESMLHIHVLAYFRLTVRAAEVIG